MSSVIDALLAYGRPLARFGALAAQLVVELSLGLVLVTAYGITGAAAACAELHGREADLPRVDT